MAPAWSVDMESYFIDKMSERKHLWDHKDPFYFKKTLKRKAFEEIGEALAEVWPQEHLLFSPDNLIKKFKNLRTYFNKEKKKILNMPSGSAGVVFTSRWAHYNRLTFLNEVAEADESLSSLSLSFDENNLSAGDMEGGILESIRNESEGRNERPPKRRKEESDVDASRISAAITLAAEAFAKPPEDQETAVQAFGRFVVKQLERIQDDEKRDTLMCDITTLINKRMYE